MQCDPYSSWNLWQTPYLPPSTVQLAGLQDLDINPFVTVGTTSHKVTPHILTSHAGCSYRSPLVRAQDRGEPPTQQQQHWYFSQSPRSPRLKESKKGIATCTPQNVMVTRKAWVRFDDYVTVRGWRGPRATSLPQYTSLRQHRFIFLRQWGPCLLVTSRLNLAVPRPSQCDGMVIYYLQPPLSLPM